MTNWQIHLFLIIISLLVLSCVSLLTKNLTFFEIQFCIFSASWIIWETASKALGPIGANSTGSNKIKPNLHDTRGITPKRVIGRVHLCRLAPGQFSSRETSQRWLVVGDTVFDLTDPGIKPQTFRTDSDVSQLS